MIHKISGRIVILLMVLAIPFQQVAAKEADKGYTEIYEILAEAQEFNGTTESILNVSEKVGALNSSSIEFTTDFKTASDGYQSLFYIGPESNDFGYASTHFITLYMTAGNQIGVEMKGVNGGYVHFYMDAPKYNDDEWHTLSLKIEAGKRTRFVLDGVEYIPKFSGNSVGMPNETQTKFVADANFEAEILTIGGAKRADRMDWLFSGMMKNMTFKTEAYIDGTPAPAILYENMDFTNGVIEKDLAEDLVYMESVKAGTISFRLKSLATNQMKLQSLLTIHNQQNDYSTIYLKGNRIGYEVRKTDSITVSGEEEIDGLENDRNWYTITLAYDEQSIDVFVDDQKAFSMPNHLIPNVIENEKQLSIGQNPVVEGSDFIGYIDQFTFYKKRMEDQYVMQTLNRNTLKKRVEIEEIPRPLPDREDAYRSIDTGLFASISSSMLFNDSLVGNPEVMGEGAFGFRIPALLRAITKDKSDKDVTIAFADKGNDSADWGNVGIANRLSYDNGKTWSNVNDMLSLPPRDAPQEFHDWGSAFYIDPLPVQANDGTIVMMVDMFPESKGLHAASWLENGTGYKTIDGKDYLVLYDGESKVGDNQVTQLGNEYTVREDGWIYDQDHERTNYYIPQNHSAEHRYETMGDMYFAVGEPDYIHKAPPYLPTEANDLEEGANDIYVGNIYLSYGKPEFDPNQPRFVKKRKVGPDQEGDLYSKYEDYETDPAPLRARVTSYLWVSKSEDYGKTWSQPIDITPQVKIPEDGAFLGVGPGTGIALQYQKDKEKNGRLVMPVYALGKGAALYSDDEGVTWKRATSSHQGYINNIDEMQFIELYDGTIMSFGRQQGKGKTPVSISKDGGETWSEPTTTDLTSVAVQKSLITYPIETDQEGTDERFAYVAGMEKGKQYVIASHARGNPNDASRTNGAISLGEVQENGEILWIAERSLKLTPNPYANTQGREDFFAYSSLAVLENGNIGILFEPQPNNYIAYAEFNLAWILNGEQEGFIREPNITEEKVTEIEQPKLVDLSLGNSELSEIKAGEKLQITTTFDEHVFVIGQASLTIEVNGQAFEAFYVKGSGGKALTFSYTVKEGDIGEGISTVAVYPRVNRQEGTVVEGVLSDEIAYDSTPKIQLYPNLKEELEKLVSIADEIQEENQYTASTWQSFIESRTSAKAVLEEPAVSNLKVNRVLVELSNALENLALITTESALTIKEHLLTFEKEGEIEKSAIRPLSTHLTAVAQYEQKKESEKIVKHMTSFKELLKHQKEKQLISEKAYEALLKNAEVVIQQWK